MIKKHETEKWRTWWSSIETAWVFHTWLRRCGLVFTVFLGEEKKQTQQQQEHIGKVDATFLPAGFVQCYSKQSVEVEQMNSLQY